ncbi:hypothetical protein [Microvirga puerhi]|uniref:Uncharacterized protein n=1 Tax=Microvirga puerhi TaxID=2876078 RepID=A0ABS7VTX4_9HYPH|nr:hypothetical protein [Microvirga puerhi]MBZ6079039.1 hypothetical protein [Microvirga puerhi]
MDINPQWITLIFASNAMIASIAGAFVNTRNAKIEFKANVLSVNRQRWIETMRDLVASLNSQLLTTAAVRHTVEEPIGTVIARDPELFRRVESLLRIVSKTELMLNPLEKDHQQLKALMSEAVDQLRSPSPGEDIDERIDIISRAIIQVSQAILKREWVRVKRGE